MTAAALASAREWGEVYGFPVVVYEWLPGNFDVCDLALWFRVLDRIVLGPRAIVPPREHALVYADSIHPLTLLGEQ